MRTLVLSTLVALPVIICAPGYRSSAESDRPVARTRRIEASPAPRQPAPGTRVTDRQCRDGTYADTVSGLERPCRDHGGVAVPLQKPDSSTGH
jgi:hypothetical protein